jgi:hypothetical protein
MKYYRNGWVHKGISHLSNPYTFSCNETSEEYVMNATTSHERVIVPSVQQRIFYVIRLYTPQFHIIYEQC